MNNNHKKLKELNLLYDYTINCYDTTYYSHILGCTDSTLSIIRSIPSGKYENVTYSHYKNKRETVTTALMPIYVKDTTDILFQDINYLRRPLFFYREWLILPWTTGIGFTLATPILAIQNSLGEEKNNLKMYAIAACVSWAICYIGTREIKYDTKKKWKLVAMHTGKSSSNSVHDSIWNFHPFSVNISSGVWMPIGKFSEYYSPDFQMGFSFGLRLTPKTRFEFGLSPRFMRNKKEIEVSIDNSNLKTTTPSSASLGGWINYETYKNKNVFIEFVSGVTWEPLSTNIENPNPIDENDTKLGISTIGISLGMNTWVNSFRNNNFGVKVLYNYAAYNMAKTIKNDLKGHTLSLSLVYSFPQRN